MPSSRLARFVLCGIVAGLPLVALGPITAGQAAETYTTAEVVRVVDGDTIKVDYDGDGRWDDAIRLIGIDTPEHDRCGYTSATRALKSLLAHKVVGLASDTGQVGRRHRPERRVHRAGRRRGQVDATTWMLERGHGVGGCRARARPRTPWPITGALTGPPRPAVSAGSTRTAAAPGRRRRAPFPCGSSTRPMRRNKLTVAERRNQEFIRIRNGGPQPLSMDGWTLRVGNDRRQQVPPGGVAIPAGETLTVHVGPGTIGAAPLPPQLRAHAGRTPTLGGGPHIGSGSYLIDPDGDIRASATWPCATSCGDPTTGFALGAVAGSRSTRPSVGPPG